MAADKLHVHIPKDALAFGLGTTVLLPFQPLLGERRWHIQTPQWLTQEGCAGAMSRPWEGAELRVPLGPAVWGVFDAALLSLQGDRGFDGLAGLPGEKGHRVSICCGIWGESF